MIQSKVGEVTHGQSGTALYECWKNMKSRCLNKNSERYYCYGAVGITICDEWLVFENFYLWAINNGYRENLTIDRIKSNLDYEPSNCQWLTYEDNHIKMMEDSKQNSKGIFSKESKEKSKSSLRNKLGKKTKIIKDSIELEFNSRGEVVEYLAIALNRKKDSVKAQLSGCLNGNCKSIGGYYVTE